MRIPMRLAFSCIVSAASFSLGCATPPPAVPVVPLPVVDTVPVPLNDLGTRTYHGVQGGLYSGGVNVPSADYHSAGVARARAVQPLAVNGTAGGTGRYVLLSIGGANVSSAWCSVSSAPPCTSWSFTGRAVSDPSVNHSALVIVNGALPGATYSNWLSAGDSSYTRIRDTRLAPLGLSENQVQAVWLTLRDSAANLPLHASPSDVAPQIEHLNRTLRVLKARYPNLQLVFISSVSYGGYSNEGDTPSYEAGVVVKWVIGSRTSADPAPWISWGPYPWARGESPRRDGLVWARSDFDSSGVKFSYSGEARLAGLLLDFFKSSPYTRCWFLIAASCE